MRDTSRRTLGAQSGMLRPAVALLAALACFWLSSCKDNTPEATTPSQPAANNASASNAAGSGGGAANSAVIAAFNKPRKPDGPVTIKVITNGISPFWDAMGKGLDEAKSKLPDCVATWQAPRSADNNLQKGVFDDAMAANVDGIAVSTIEADAFAPVINGAIDKGIPVITFDSDSPKSKRLVYIGTNNFEAGRRAGEEAVKLFPNGAKLVAFVGNMSAQNANDRYNGFKEGVKGHNIEFLQDPFTDDKDIGRARRNVDDAITKYGDQINGFVGLYSYNGPAIVDEVVKNDLRSKVKIICFDGEPKTLVNLGKGLVDVTVVQKPYEFGRLSTKLLYLINRKGFTAAMEELKPELDQLGMKVNGDNIDTGVEVVTPGESATKFLQKLKEMGLSST